MQTTQYGLPQSPSRNPHTTNHRSFPASAKCGSGSQGGRPATSPASKWRPLHATHGHKQGTEITGVCTTGTPDTPLRTQLGVHRGPKATLAAPYLCMHRPLTSEGKGWETLLFYINIWKRQATGRKQVEREPQLQVRCSLSGTAFSVEPGSLQSKQRGHVSPQTPKPHNPCSYLHTHMHLDDSHMDPESIQQRFWTDPGMAIHQPHPPSRCYEQCLALVSAHPKRPSDLPVSKPQSGLLNSALPPRPESGRVQRCPQYSPAP